MHELASCSSADIGEGSKIWQFTQILAGARIGKDCNISAGVFIEGQVTLGDRVTVKSGTQMWNGVTVEDDAFVGPNVTFTNDRNPRSKNYPPQWETTIVKSGSSIGGNATILPGVTIGEFAMIGAGAVVVANVPPRALVFGNPAMIQGFVDEKGMTIRPLQCSELLSEGNGHSEIFVSAIPGTVDSGNTLSSLSGAVFAGFRYPKISVLRGREYTMSRQPQFAAPAVIAPVQGAFKLHVKSSERTTVMSMDSQCPPIRLLADSEALPFAFTRNSILLVISEDDIQSS